MSLKMAVFQPVEECVHETEKAPYCDWLQFWTTAYIYIAGWLDDVCTSSSREDYNHRSSRESKKLFLEIFQVESWSPSRISSVHKYVYGIAI
jgi:hypothetical protein